VSGEGVNGVRISDSTVRRLSGYYRILGDLRESGDPTISSYELARRAGVTPAQVRKDLSFFGHFGKRGTAYKEFEREGFEIRAVLDNDGEKIGQKWGNLAIEPVEDLEKVVKERDVEIGIITTPAVAAQEVADGFVAAGVEGILNFAPRKLFVAEHVNLRNVNLAIELESLSFALK
jgi:redox-sensing transcriptional repressor